MRISGKKSRRPLQGEIQKKEWVKRIRKEKMRMKKLFDYAAKYLERPLKSMKEGHWRNA